MPLYKCVDHDWLLLVVDAKGQKCSVFDSLVRRGASAQAALIDNAVSTFTWLSHFTVS